MVLKTACWLLTRWHGWKHSTWLCSTMVHAQGMEVLQRPLSCISEKMVCWTCLGGTAWTAVRHEP